MRENLLASWRQFGQKQDPCPSLLNHNAKYKRLLPPYCDFANSIRPTIIANERIIFEGVPQPAEREPVRLLASFWDCMRVHKGFEPLTGRLDHLSLCGLIQHGRREHHFERNDVAKIGADGEPFDVAHHTPAHEKSRFENRWQSAVLLDRNQNGLHGRRPNPEQGCSWQDTSNRRSTNTRGALSLAPCSQVLDLPNDFCGPGRTAAVHKGGRSSRRRTEA